MAEPTRSRMARKPTLEDVARLAGVSRALVSIVIRGVPGASPETRARVMAVAGQLGYRPDVRARLLARTSSRLLGVTFRVGALHHDDLIPSIYAAAEAAGYEVILSGKTIAHDERQAVNALLGYRCDAILMLGPDLSEAELNDIATTIPVIVVGRRLIHHTDTVDVVRTHEHAGMGMAVEHLVRLGHTRITHVDGGPGTMASDRRRGYREHMTRLGLESEIRIVHGGETVEAGRQATAAALDVEPIADSGRLLQRRVRLGTHTGGRGAWLGHPSRLVRSRLRRKSPRPPRAAASHNCPPGFGCPGPGQPAALHRPDRGWSSGHGRGADTKPHRGRDHGTAAERLSRALAPIGGRGSP